MQRITGGGLPALIWRDFMGQALDGRPVKPLVARATEPGSNTRSFWQRLFGTPDAETPTAPGPKRSRESDSDGGP